MTGITIAFVSTWAAVFFAIPEAGFDIELWVRIVSASVGGLFSSLLVLLGESVIEDIVKLLVVLVISGIVSGTNPELGYIFISTLISGVMGVIINQINQYAVRKHW
jgi:hypothetical protein